MVVVPRREAVASEQAQRNWIANTSHAVNHISASEHGTNDLGILEGKGLRHVPVGRRACAAG